MKDREARGHATIVKGIELKCRSNPNVPGLAERGDLALTSHLIGAGTACLILAFIDLRPMLATEERK